MFLLIEKKKERASEFPLPAFLLTAFFLGDTALRTSPSSLNAFHPPIQLLFTIHLHQSFLHGHGVHNRGNLEQRSVPSDLFTSTCASIKLLVITGSPSYPKCPSNGARIGPKRLDNPPLNHPTENLMEDTSVHLCLGELHAFARNTRERNISVANPQNTCSDPQCCSWNKNSPVVTSLFLDLDAPRVLTFNVHISMIDAHVASGNPLV